jgi:membrane-associated phospholipid phosphatase
VDSLPAIDAGLALLVAGLAEKNLGVAEWLFHAADSAFTKSLLFAPWLLVAWSRGGPAERERVLATPASCGLALAITWVVTTLWRRPRPLHPASGLEEIASAFSASAEVNPGWLHWGCFPSDHAAYLTALGLGLYSLNRGVGAAALAVGIGVCCLARMCVGLHYASDVVAGVAVGALAHVTVSRALAGFAAARFRQLRESVEANAWLQLGFAVLVVEMAVMFRDLRTLDTWLFPLP